MTRLCSEQSTLPVVSRLDWSRVGVDADTDWKAVVVIYTGDGSLGQSGGVETEVESLEEYLGDKVHRTWGGMGVAGWREAVIGEPPGFRFVEPHQLGTIHRDRGPLPERGNCRGR